MLFAAVINFVRYISHCLCCSHQLADAVLVRCDVLDQLPPAGLHLLLDGRAAEPLPQQGQGARHRPHPRGQGDQGGQGGKQVTNSCSDLLDELLSAGLQIRFYFI